MGGISRRIRRRRGGGRLRPVDDRPGRASISESLIDISAVGDADDEDEDFLGDDGVDDDVIPARVDASEFRMAFELDGRLAVSVLGEEAEPAGDAFLDVRGKVGEFALGLWGELDRESHVHSPSLRWTSGQLAALRVFR